MSDSIETVDQLRAQLDASVDKGEQAGLLDAIGIRLTMQGQSLEALEYSARALAIRARLADADVHAESLLGVSLFNRGGHLSALARFDEAVSYYATAYRVFGRHLTDSLTLGRFARNAAQLSSALGQLGAYDMAARFQGAAVGALLEASGLEDDESAEALNAETGRLAEYLDSFDRDRPAPATELPSDDELLSLPTRSLPTARWLCELTTQRFREHQLVEAVEWAYRTVRYCDLFATEDAAFAAISTDTMQRAVAWPVATRSRDDLAIEARLKGRVHVESSTAPHRTSSEIGRPPSAETPIDRRLWCCSARDLFLMLRDLSVAGIPSSDVHTLASRLRAGNIYPARDYAHRCQPRLPDVFITHDWRHDVHALHREIHGFLTYVGQTLFQKRPDLDPERIRHLMFHEIGLWIDFIFIDQSGRDLGAEVRSVLPRVIGASELHFVLSETALLRSWCCYECVLFNQRPVSSSAFPATQAHGLDAEAWGALAARPLRSFVLQSTRLEYRGFAQTETTTPEDKQVLQQYLEAECPEGMAGVDRLLLQASMLSDRFVTPGFAQYHGAEDLAVKALDKWLER